MLREREVTEGYTLYEDTPLVKIWAKVGSPFDTTTHVLKTRYTFSGKNDMRRLISLLNEKRHTWDKNIIEQTVIATLSPSVSLVHYSLKPPMMFMKSRDFVEKHVEFLDNNMYFMYSSSIPDSEYPINSKYERAYNIYSVAIIECKGSDIIYDSIYQIDAKVLSFPMAMVMKLVKSTIYNIQELLSSALDSTSSILTETFDSR